MEITLFRKDRRWLQYVATLTATLCMFISGMHNVWSSPALPKLYSNESSIPITRYQGSTIASLHLLSELVLVPFAAYFSNVCGRKALIVFTAVPYLIAWLVTAFATSVTTLYGARLLVGVGDASAYTVVPIYVGEIAESDIRGKLSISSCIMSDIGILVMYSIGPYLSIRMSALVASLFPVILVGVFVWMPESPYHLLVKGDKSKAKKSLQKLRGKENVDQELLEINEAVEDQMSRSSSWKELVTVKSNLKGLLIVFGMRLAKTFSGVTPLLFYAQLIFQDAGSGVAPHISAIVFGFVKCLSTFTSSMLVDRWGRKPLLCVSCFGSGTAIGMLAVYFYFKEKTDYDISFLNWLPLSVVVVYIFLFGCGLGVMSYVLCGEMFAINVKSKAFTVIGIENSLLAFTVTKFYQIVADSFGNYLPFSIFSCCCFLSCFFAIFCIPETKGISLADVQNILKKKQPTEQN